jgi:RNA polymerase sigma factor (sigma-70 family)
MATDRLIGNQPRPGGVGMAEVEGRPLNDTELIEAARHGEVSAYEELVRRYEDLAFRTAFLVVRDADEARDAAQDAFLRAHRALATFRAGAEFRPWLLRIVANAARNRRRSAARRADLALRVAREPASGDAAPSPEAALLSMERRETLLAAINSLPEDDRLVIGLRWFVELGESEMASALGRPRGTVKSRLSRAMVRLRVALARLEGPLDD